MTTLALPAAQATQEIAPDGPALLVTTDAGGQALYRKEVVYDRETKEIPLTKGKITIVDAADYPSLQPYGWYYVVTGPNQGYARATIDGKAVYMHRFLTQAPDGVEVDHIDLDRLNNRRSNLRIVTTAQNQCNTAKRPGTLSQYKGVTFDKQRGRWKAAIKLPDTKSQKNLGCFDTEIEAAKAYDTAAVRAFGGHARINFPAPQKPSAPLYRKEIVYDRESRDYACYLDGELVGFGRTYHECEVTLDQLVFELISGQYFTASRPAELAPDVLYACPCAADPLTAALADDPNARPATHADPSLPDETPAGRDALVGASTAPFIRMPEHDLRPPHDALVADAWTCGDHTFWTDLGYTPLTCPRCDGLAAVSPTTRACPACGRAHTLSHCEELAAEWRNQAQAEIRAGARVGAHITRDIAGFLREYATLTEEQRAGVVASYCAWQRAEARPLAVAKRWARMAGLV